MKNKIKTSRQDMIKYFLTRGKNVDDDEAEIDLKGDENKGTFFLHDGQGNYFSAAWDESALVAMAFNHEAPNVKDEEDYPEMEVDWDGIKGIPTKLKPLAEKAFDPIDTGPTVGLWSEKDDIFSSQPMDEATECGLYMIEDILR